MNEMIWDDLTWLVEFMFTSFNDNTILVLVWTLEGRTLTVRFLVGGEIEICGQQKYALCKPQNNLK